MKLGPELARIRDFQQLVAQYLICPCVCAVLIVHSQSIFETVTVQVTLFIS